MNITSPYFAFLRYCLGYKGNIGKVIAGMDWQELYSFASKQALLGLYVDGIERLGKKYSKELKRNPIGRELLVSWMGKAQQIRRQNMKVNAVAGKLVRCVKGRVLDVAVDIRRGSPTYGKLSQRVSASS